VDALKLTDDFGRRGADQVHTTRTRLKRSNDQRSFTVSMHAEKRKWIAMPARNNSKGAIVNIP
jgi:hypothetical protein